MSTPARVTVSRPAGPDGPAVLAVYQDSPVPLVAIPLTPARVLRLCRDLLAAVEPDELTPPPAPASALDPILTGARACQIAACATPETCELAGLILARGRFPRPPGQRIALESAVALAACAWAFARLGDEATDAETPAALQTLAAKNIAA